MGKQQAPHLCLGGLRFLEALTEPRHLTAELIDQLRPGRVQAGVLAGATTIIQAIARLIVLAVLTG